MQPGLRPPGSADLRALGWSSPRERRPAISINDPFDPPTDLAARSAYLRRRAELARLRAQTLMATISRTTYQSDPAILGQVKAILALPPTERLEMLMDELAVFANARLVIE